MKQPTWETIKRALMRASIAGLASAIAAIAFVPMNFTDIKKYAFALAVALGTGFLMGVHKFLNGWIRYDMKK